MSRARGTNRPIGRTCPALRSTRSAIRHHRSTVRLALSGGFLARNVRQDGGCGALRCAAERLKKPMPTEEAAVRRRARRDEREGKAPTTQAGEFVREEVDHVREGKHGARSPKQAIAIGLSKARRAGVKLPAPQARATSDETRRRAKRDAARGRGASSARRPSVRRAKASEAALKRESGDATSHESLSSQARSAAAKREPSRPSAAAAKKGARTKGAPSRKAAARKAARSRAAR